MHRHATLDPAGGELGKFAARRGAAHAVIERRAGLLRIRFGYLIVVEAMGRILDTGKEAAIGRRAEDVIPRLVRSEYRQGPEHMVFRPVERIGRNLQQIGIQASEVPAQEP
jgi:hypothetical protein